MNPAKTGALALLLFFASSVPAQVKPVPKWVEESVLNPSLSTPRGKDDGNSYLLVDEQYHVPERHVFFHYAIRVNAETGLHDASQIEISYDPTYQKAAIHYIRVYRNGQVQDRTGTDTIRVLDQEKEKSEGILTGNRSLYVNLSDVRVGDVVEYAYSRQGESRIFANHYTYYFEFSYNVPVGEMKARMIFDKNASPSLLNSNTDAEPGITRGDNLIYEWRKSQLPAVIKENNTPSWFNPNAIVYVSSFADWSAVKSWALDLFQPGTYDTRELQTVCDSIRSRHPGNVQRQIDEACTFVQDNVRYSGNEQGIYSHKPHTPDWVLANRYGDCKDKALLLSEMLHLLGVKAWPALVHTAMAHTVPSMQPSFARFNHCITAIEYKGVLSYVDGTAILERGPFQERSCAVYGVAMVLDSAASAFSVIPPDRASGNVVREEFRIHESGDATLKATFRFMGERANDARRYFAANSISAIQESYLTVYTGYSDTIEVIDTVTFTDDPQRNVFETVEHYRFKSFWVQKSTDDKVQKSFIPHFLNRSLTYPDEKSRRQPMSLSHPVKITHVIVVHLEGGFSIPPAVFLENNDAFRYRYETETRGDSMVLTYNYESKTREVAADSFPAYLAATDRVSSNMILTAEQHELDEKEKGFNWMLCLLALLTLALSILACVQLEKKDIDRGFASRYRSIGAWLVLLAIGIVLTPIALTIQLLGQWGEQWQINYYSYYYNSESYGYDPFRGTFMLTMFCCNVILLVASSFMIYQLFKRRNTFPLYYTLYKLFNVAVLLCSALFTYFFFYTPGVSAEVKALNEERTSVFTVGLQALIWIPYLWYSTRSRHTFTEGPKPAAGEAL